MGWQLGRNQGHLTARQPLQLIQRDYSLIGSDAFIQVTHPTYVWATASDVFQLLTEKQPTYKTVDVVQVSVPFYLASE